ncbi:MAG TPA: pirin family protein [Bacteroidia bacterium]|nr:pirin family protein [Bacteroidia bacterium]
MKTIIHKANDRGKADHGWLKTAFSFSFSEYYNPEKIHFGMLRVLNDDNVAPKMGFGMHPHDNMEIVTIPMVGSLEHKDNMGNSSVIKTGEVQIMSAGTGVMHSEFNPSQTEATQLFQIWIFPKERNIKPRYDQKDFSELLKNNSFNTLVSPIKSDETLWINQNAYFSIGKFDAGQKASYNIQSKGNGVYLFVIEGKIEAETIFLERRDAVGISETDNFIFDVKENSHLLAIEVPMN